MYFKQYNNRKACLLVQSNMVMAEGLVVNREIDKMIEWVEERTMELEHSHIHSHHRHQIGREMPKIEMVGGLTIDD